MQATQSKRLVITGLGPVTPVAIGIDDFQQRVFANKLGNTAVVDDGTASPEKSRPSKKFLVGTLDPQRIEQERARIQNLHKISNFKNPIPDDDPRSAQIAQIAADLALRDAGLLKDDEVKLSSQVVDPSSVEIHTTAGTEITVSKDIVEYLKESGRLRPTSLPKASPNFVAGRLSESFGIRGLTQVIQAACAGAISCIDNAIKSLREEGTDTKVALLGSVETDSIGPAFLNVFKAAGIVKSLAEDQTQQYYRPFDTSSEGVRLSEGAGYLVLEELEHAKARKAKIYAEVVASAQKSDASKQMAPDGIGLENAMRAALKKANLQPTDITFIQVHGSGNEKSDQAEINALTKVFGDHLPKLKVTANKSRHGHTLHNSAFVNIAELALSLKEQKASPNLALEKNPLDRNFPLVGTKAEDTPGEYGMAFGLGIGGTNAVVILKRYQGD